MANFRRSDNRRHTLRFWFWAVTFLVWGLLVCAYVPAVILVSQNHGVTPLEATALFGVGAASSVVWFAGIRHLLLWLVSLRALDFPVGDSPLGDSLMGPRQVARVALLYCTANDFNGVALRRSMSQISAVTTLILDDSSQASARDEIDQFARDNDAEVIRRFERSGYKAGNLNNALAQILHRFDYFVVVDSDEILAPTFVTQALRNFSADPSIGIVQGRHRAISAGTGFSTLFAGLLETHISVVHRARTQIGFTAFMGRGAMISAECLRAVGRIPEVVTEDVALSLEARIVGFRVEYDHSIVSVEDYPINYHAFRLQHAKNVEGTTEFILGSTKRILRSRLKLSEKIDLIVEQLTAPLSGLAGVLLLASGLVIAALSSEARPPVWSIIATGIFGVAALVPETVRRLREDSFRGALLFLAASSALYGSTIVLTVGSMFKVLFGGRAIFHITPKSVHTMTFADVLRQLRVDIFASVVLIVSALLVAGSVVPALSIVGPTVAGILFYCGDLVAMRRKNRELTAVALKLHPLLVLLRTGLGLGVKGP